MTVLTDVNKLFLDVLGKSDIKRVMVNGFEKYIVYNESGTLFVVGYNQTTKQHGFGRTQLMLEQYKRAKLSTKILPDYKVLYFHLNKIYPTYKSVMNEFRPIFDMIDTFCGKTR